MYLHLGSDYMIKNSEIIAIFNLKDDDSDIYKEYIRKYGSKYEIIDASEGEEFYSCVLTEDKIYLSAISSATLKKRLEENVLLDFDVMSSDGGKDGSEY